MRKTINRPVETLSRAIGMRLALLGALLLAASAQADEALLTAEQQLEVENAQLAWQRERLLHPSTAQRRAEAEHQVFVYVAITDRDVEEALDTGFERMESFVFANVVVTDEEGRPLRDPDSGRLVLESEDCD